MVLLRHLHLLKRGILAILLVRRDVAAIANRFIGRGDMHVHLFRSGIRQIGITAPKTQPTHWCVEAGVAVVEIGILLEVAVEVEKLCKIFIARPADHAVVLHFLRPYNVRIALLLSHHREDGGLDVKPAGGLRESLEEDTTLKEGTLLSRGDAIARSSVIQVTAAKAPIEPVMGRSSANRRSLVEELREGELGLTSNDKAKIEVGDGPQMALQQWSEYEIPGGFWRVHWGPPSGVVLVRAWRGWCFGGVLRSLRQASCSQRAVGGRWRGRRTRVCR